MGAKLFLDYEMYGDFYAGLSTDGIDFWLATIEEGSPFVEPQPMAIIFLLIVGMNISIIRITMENGEMYGL